MLFLVRAYTRICRSEKFYLKKHTSSSAHLKLVQFVNAAAWRGADLVNNARHVIFARFFAFFWYRKSKKNRFFSEFRVEKMCNV